MMKYIKHFRFYNLFILWVLHVKGTVHADVKVTAPAEWNMSQNYSFCLSVSHPLLKPCSCCLCTTGLRLGLMGQRPLYAILAGRFFTFVIGGGGGWRPFKWSTCRLWPVINEFAVSHGSCKETSGRKRERDSDFTGKQGWKMAAPNILSLIQKIIYSNSF